MAETETSLNAPSNVLPEIGAVRETRFDPPHEIARDDVAGPAATPSASVEAAFSAMSADADESGIPPELVQQFRSQAQQLASYLEVRQRDLDRRDSELHARLAQHETSSRNARLWFQERHHDLIDRQTQLEEREQQLNDRLIDLDQRVETQRTASQAVLEHQHQQADEIATREDQLLIRDVDLQQRQTEINDLVAQVAQRQHRCECREIKLQHREEQLARSEALLARSQVELQDERDQFQGERAETCQRLDQQQQKLIDDRRRAEIEIEKQRAALTSRSEHLERRTAALDHLRGDLVRLQRETLEMRLATEELWAEMSGLVPPAAITQSLARLRTKLADHFRMQSSDLASQKTEVEELASKVAQQHERMALQKRDFETWAAAQRREIESLAAHLVARETELDDQQQQQQHQRQQWDAQRHELERQIRGLQAELRRQEADAMATDQ